MIILAGESMVIILSVHLNFAIERGEGPLPSNRDLLIEFITVQILVLEGLRSRSLELVHVDAMFAISTRSKYSLIASISNS